MSLATRAGDLFYTFRFLKAFTTPWPDTDAAKLGIVDENGKRNRKVKLDTDEKRDAYTPFLRLVYNLKRLVNMAPGGKSKMASYAAGLLLLKDHFGMTDKGIDKILQGMEIDPLDLISEKNEWWLLPSGAISPGVYQITNYKLTCESLDDIVYPKDRVMVHENCFPVDEVLGIPVYKVTHINTKKAVYVTLGELYK